MHAEHSHLPAFCVASKFLNPESAGGAAIAPGLACSQHEHFETVFSLRVKQEEHSHLEFCAATKFLKPLSIATGFGALKADVDGVDVDAPGLA
jgi:hypothetical protein